MTGITVQPPYSLLESEESLPELREKEVRQQILDWFKARRSLISSVEQRDPHFNPNHPLRHMILDS